MKTFLVAATLALALPAALPQSQPQTIQGTWSSDARNYWTRNDSERWVSIELRRDESSRHSFSLPERELPALNDRAANGPVHFTVKREAGSFDFTGDMRDGRASGDFRFTPDQGYAGDLTKLGYSGLSTDEVWRFAM